MGYIYTNPNPKGAITGDCVVRAVAIANNLDWDTAYLILSDYGFRMKNMPNADSVWSKVLKDFGFKRRSIPDSHLLMDWRVTPRISASCSCV